MELRLENPKNIYSDRYITFSKHRRGDVGVKFFYSLSSTGDVSFDEQRFRQDQRIKHMQSEVAGQIRDFADQFDKLFTPEWYEQLKYSTRKATLYEWAMATEDH